MGFSMKILPQMLVGVALSLVVTSADAVIIFSPTPSGTGNNVIFNQQPPDQTGTTIFGNINSVDTLVQFTSTQVLTTPSQGQARIESVPDNILNNLTTTIPGFDFTQAVFNLDATINGLRPSTRSTSLARSSASCFRSVEADRTSSL
jgi:hypothetical protein